MRESIEGIKRINRTGIGMSPMDAQAMLRNVDDMSPSQSGSGSGSVQGSHCHARIFELRGVYLKGAEPIGSVPPPRSMQGAMKAILHKLKGDRIEVLLDRLGERAAYERTGTRLYDLLIGKCMARPGDLEDIPIKRLGEIREEELRHFEMLNQTIRDLGGDPTAMTSAADISGMMAHGILQVLADPRTTVPQSLQGLLLAEVGDVEGWDLLIKLTNELEMNDLAKKFQQANLEESRHVADIRDLLSKSVLSDTNLLH